MNYLYKVSVYYETMCYAENGDEAIKLAEKNGGEDWAMFSEDFDYCAEKIHGPNDIPKKWQNAIPWGGEETDDKDCSEIFEDEYVKADKKCQECGGTNGFHIEHCSGNYSQVMSNISKCDCNEKTAFNDLCEECRDKRSMSYERD